MSVPERIERSRQIAEQFLHEALPTYKIKPVPRDGYCIIHAYREALLYCGWVVTFEELVEKLRKELTDRKDYYMSMSLIDDTDILEEFEEYMRDPMSKYDKDIADYFLYALGSAFKVNVILFQSDDKTCRIMDQTENGTTYNDNCYFVRTLSLHWDPVTPTVLLESDSDIEFTGFVAPTEVKTYFSDSDSDIIITKDTRSMQSTSRIKGEETASSGDEFYIPSKIRKHSVQFSSKSKYNKHNDQFSSSDSEIEDVPLSSSSITPNGTVVSPAELTVYHNYRFDTESLGEYYSMLSETNIVANPSIYPSSVVPWHVSKSCTLIINLHKLPSRDDLTYDCWWWTHLGAYTVVADHTDDTFRKPHTKEDIVGKVKIVRRTYRCKEDTRLQKAIVATYPVGVSATKDGFRAANRFAVIEYTWEAKEDIPMPKNDKKKRVYPSVKEDVRKFANLGGKKAAFEGLQSRGGLKGIRNSSEVIGRREAYYELSKSSNPSSLRDPLANIIKKYHMEEGKNGVIHSIAHAKPAYDIALLNETCVKNIAVMTRSSFCHHSVSTLYFFRYVQKHDFIHQSHSNLCNYAGTITDLPQEIGTIAKRTLQTTHGFLRGFIEISKGHWRRWRR